MSEITIPSFHSHKLYSQTGQTKENKKDAFLKEAHNYIVTNDDHTIFEKIIKKRLEQLIRIDEHHQSNGNLDSQYSSETMSMLINSTTLLGVPNFYHYIELKSQSLFGGLLQFWSEYKRYVMLLDSNFHLWDYGSNGSSIIQKFELEHGYYAELILNIEKDERRFLTHFSSRELRLSNANTLLNLETFVKQQHWYEMLFELNLSAKGEHFILYQQNDDDSCTLIASAKIQRWNEKSNWLAFTPFFQSESWTVSLGDHNVNALEASGMFNDRLDINLNLSAPRDLDQSFAKSLKHGQDCCELIRMAISGPTSKLNTVLFLTIKHIAIFMENFGIKGVYVVTEQPALLYFFQYVNLYSDMSDCYVPMAYQQINPSSPYTYKGLILSDPMVKAIGECNYKQYYKQVLSARKKSTTHFASCLKF